jgi:hypothetical protein
MPMIESKATCEGSKAEFVQSKCCTNLDFSKRVTVWPDGCVSATCQQCGEATESLEPSRCFYCSGIMCWLCWDLRHGICRGCESIAQRYTDKMQAIRAKAAASHKSGRPRKLRACPYCKKRFGARELRHHKVVCGNPELKAEMLEAYADVPRAGEVA